MSHRNYVNLCVGHRNKEIRREYLDRELNYNIVRGWADPKTLPSKEKFWSIGGEPVKTIKMPSRAKLLKYDAAFRSLGKKKDG